MISQAASHPSVLGRPRRFGSTRGILMGCLILVVAFLTLYPLILILAHSVMSGAPGQAATWSLDGYRALFTPRMLKTIGATFIIAIPTVVISTALAVVFSWLVTRTDLPGRGFIEPLLWAGILVPPATQALGWILLLDPSYGILNKAAEALPFISSAPFNAYSYTSIIWASLATATSFRFLLIAPAFRNLDASLEEAGRIAGHGPLSTLTRVTVPLLRPAILASAFLGLILAIESFEVPLLMGTPARIHVFSTQVYAEINSVSGANFNGAAALSTFFLVVVLALAWLYNKSISGTSFTTLTGKTTHQTPVRLSRKGKVVALVGIGLYFTVFLLLPILVTLLGTFMKLFGFFNITPVFTMDHWRETLSNPQLLHTLGTTITFALLAAVIGGLLYAVLSYVILRTRTPGRRLLGFLSWLPWATPGILLGFGLLQVFLQTPGLRLLYGSIAGLTLAIIITQAPLGVQMIGAALTQQSHDLEEVGRVAGAGFAFRLRKIILPLMAPTLLTVGLLVFAAAARDVATVTLISTAGQRTLSLLTVDYVATPDLGAASVSGFLLILLILAAAVVHALLARRVRR